MIKTLPGRLLALLGVLVAFIMANILAPAQAGATTAWSASVNCYFNPSSYVRVQTLIDSYGSGKRPTQLAWGGSEHPNEIDAWEDRGGTNIYTGQLLNYKPYGATSGFTSRYYPPYMASGATRRSEFDFWRNALTGNRCGNAHNIG